MRVLESRGKSVVPDGDALEGFNSVDIVGGVVSWLGEGFLFPDFPILLVSPLQGGGFEVVTMKRAGNVQRSAAFDGLVEGQVFR